MTNGMCRLMKKLLAAAMAACLLLVTCSCSGAGDETEPCSDTAGTEPATEQTVVSAGILKIAYNASDSMDPFEAETTGNCQILNLLYDTLFKLDSSYRLSENIGSTWEKDGNTVRVKLRSGVKFTDGSEVTAGDVVYSFNRAKAGKRYASMLSDISAYADGELDVVFTYSEYNRYGENLLIFPVVKADTLIGTGRYTLDSQDGGTSMFANEEWFGGNVPVREIQLISVSGTNELYRSYLNGDINFAYFDFSDGNERRLGGSVKSVPLNNFVYMGINSKSPALSEPYVRRAIYHGCDMSALTSDAFGSCGISSTTPFNPSWYEFVGEMWSSTQTYSADAARELLSVAGYSQVDASGIRSDGNTSLTFKMIINSDNMFRVNCANAIAQQLLNIGISVNVVELSWEDYTEAIRNGDYDLYIGEVLIKPDMDLSALLESGGGASFGITFPNQASDAYSSFAQGNLTLSEFVSSFNEYMPFVPICYRAGSIVSSAGFTSNAQPSESDVFLNIQDW